MGHFISQLLSIFSNDHASLLLNLLTWATLILVIIAFYFNWKASRHGLTRLRRVHFIIAGFAVGYIVAYIAFLFCDIPIPLWAEWLRSIGLFTWVFVWMAPARESIKLWEELQEKLEELTEEGLDDN